MQHAAKIELVRKKGSTLGHWYGCVAVFSGSYIYFYPAEKFLVIQEVAAALQREKSAPVEEAGGSSVAARGQDQTALEGSRLAEFQQKFAALDYAESFIVKGCLADSLTQDLKQLRARNSLRYECHVEFSTQEACTDWSEMILGKAEQIEDFLNRDGISIGGIGEFTTRGLSLKEQASVIGEKLDQKNDYDYLVKDDPHQLQQAYEVSIGTLTLVLEATARHQLRSKTAGAAQHDVLVFSATWPQQFNRADPEEHADGSRTEERFAFQGRASKFFFGFYYREFDQDVSISLESLRLYDSSSPAQLLAMRDQAAPVPAPDDDKRYPTLLSAEPSSDRENLAKLELKLQALKSPRYKNVAIEVDVAISRVTAYWHPATFNRLLRFIRFVKYPWEVVEREKLSLQ